MPNELPETSQNEISISQSAWKPMYDSYPLGLVAAILWLAGFTLAQNGVGWLLENEHLSLPDWSPKFGAQICIMVMATLVLLLYWKVIRKGDLRGLGLRVDRLPGDLLFTVVAIAVAGLGYLILAGVVWLALPLFVEDRDATVVSLLHQAAYENPSPLFLVGVVVLFPIIEEIWFRGLLYTPMRKEWGKWPAIIIVSILFALAHPWPPVTQFIGGLIFVVAYELRRSLLPAIILHALGNGSLWILGIALETYQIT